MKRFLVLGTTAIAAAVLAASAAADAAYHSERVDLHPIGGAPGTGAVVNIHVNGPRVYAHEVYTLRGAVAGTYAVFLNVFPTSLNCTGAMLSFPTATLETNAQGNGQADVKLTPENVAGFRGMTFSISWTVSGPATYVSGCTIVRLD